MRVKGQTERRMIRRRWIRRVTALAVASCIAVLLPLDTAEAASAFSSRAPFVKTGRDVYYHNARFSGDLIATGVDVSYIQSTRGNWNTAKKYSVDYAIIRVTWTGYRNGTHSYKHIDDNFADNYKRARAAGVMTGAYVFSQARTVTEARREATWAVKRLQQLGIEPEDMELPVYMDYEYAGPSSGSNKGRLYGVSAATATKCANAFCKVIRDAGYDPGIYACTNFYSTKIIGSELDDDIDLWCAQYSSSCTSNKNYNKWQFSSTARIYGILSSVTQSVCSTDVNYWYLERARKSTGSRDIAGMNIYGSTYVNYTGKPVLPKLQVYKGTKLLKEGRDYIVGGINNVFRGNQQAYAYVKGVGDYNGYALVPFTIGSGYAAHKGLASCRKSGKIIFGMAGDAGSSFRIGSNSQGGYIRNVTKGLTVKQFLSKLTFIDGVSGYSMAVLSNKGVRLTSSVKVATGMMLGIYKNGKLVGTADITIKGYNIKNQKGNDPSMQQKVVKVSITSLKAAKKAFKVKTDQHLSFVDGYQVKYSTDPDMTNAKIVTIGSDSYSNSGTVKGLKAGTTYYVKARTYYEISGVRYYSAWSKAESVTTK